MRRTICRIIVLTALVAATASGVGAEPCTVDSVPAATLLVPYFEVDLDACTDPPSEYRTTRLRVTNIARAPVLTHVTLWSNLGVPVAGFDLYLQGYDLQELDLADILCSGAIPATGKTTSPLGQYSDPAVDFSGCGDPVSGDLSPTEVADLRAYLIGKAAPSTGLCAGVPVPEDPVSDVGLAQGYLTVDVVSVCTSLTPAQSTYYSSAIGFQNVLVGEYALIDPINNYAEGFSAVTIEAAPGVFSPGDVTFYGRYNSASAADQREPLGTTYRMPYYLAGLFDATEVIVWRETTKVEQPFPCASPPAWYPLSSGTVLAFPESDTSLLGAIPAHASLPRATQRVVVGGPNLRLHPASSPFGWLYLDLQHGATIYAPTPHLGQAWVASRRLAFGRFAVGSDGVALDSACTNAPFTFTAPPRTTYSDDPHP